MQKLLPYLVDKTFNIVGYSYGGLISMNLVLRLESMGYSGRLVLIDSAPEMMQLYSRTAFADKIDDNLQVQTILKIVDNSVRATRKAEVSVLIKSSQYLQFNLHSTSKM